MHTEWGVLASDLTRTANSPASFHVTILMLFTSQRSVTAALRQIAARPGCRSYALSRFTTPRTGVSRARRIPSARVSGSSEPASLTPRSPPPPREDTPSGEESLLWHASQRPPNSNAADGLKKLLLGSNTLVIERWAGYSTLVNSANGLQPTYG